MSRLGIEVNPMNEHDTLIRELGGPSELRRRLGVSTHNWPERGIPWRWRPKVARMAEEHGIAVPDDFLEPPTVAEQG